MKILWFPRLQPDKNNLGNLVTWRELCKELELLGCTVRVAVAERGKENMLNRKDIIRIFEIRRKYLRILSFWISGYAKFVYNYLKFKPDVVILEIYSVWFSIPFVFYRRRNTVFIIDDRTPYYGMNSNEFTLQDRIIRFYTKLSYRFSKYFLNGMTVITDYYKEYIHENFKYPSSLIGVWGTGVDINKFSPSKKEYSNKPIFLKDKFVVMQHGELSYNRGLMESLEAVSLISKEDICLLLIGEGRIKNDLIQKIKELGLEKNVFVLPPVDYAEVPAYIGYCDCAVMAYPNIEYWNNNSPIKMLEYFAMGKVVICTDMLTFRTVGGNNKSIYYIKDNNPETIADAIRYCYENKNLLEEWGKEGIAIVRERFTWHQQAKSILGFIMQLQKELSC